MRGWVAAIAIVLCVACGDDDDDGGMAIDAGAIDAAGGAVDAGAIDGSASGTQGLGQFCNTLPDGGPHCQSGLDCCSDTSTCREPDDCSGSAGYLPCDDGSDCPSSKLCCQTSAMTFCTKPSACSAYGGTEIP